MTGDSDRKSPRDAAHAVMQEIHSDLLRMLTRRLGDKDEAADVLHDFFVKVLARIDDVRDTDRIRGWMRRVLETSIVDHYRAETRKRRSEADYHYLEAVYRAEDQADADLDSAACLCLYKLLPTLKAGYADILWRADLIGEPRESITAELGITETNFRVRLHRARQALRRRLEETCRTCPFHGYLDCDCEYGIRYKIEIGQEHSKL